MFQLDGNILLCADIDEISKCLKLEGGTWMEHSSLNKRRAWETVVPTKTATFIFGGNKSRKTYEYLPKDSTTWLMGKTEIPGCFFKGCAIAVKSDQEIWLIGGYQTLKRILSFNVKDHTLSRTTFSVECGKAWTQMCFHPKHQQSHDNWWL